jgi:hypothetical protein
MEPNVTIITVDIRLYEPKELEEGECLFHSQLWVKATPLHFIVDNINQKNMILVEVITRLNLLVILHP